MTVSSLCLISIVVTSENLLRTIGILYGGHSVSCKNVFKTLTAVLGHRFWLHTNPVGLYFDTWKWLAYHQNFYVMSLLLSLASYRFRCRHSALRSQRKIHDPHITSQKDFSQRHQLLYISKPFRFVNYLKWTMRTWRNNHSIFEFLLEVEHDVRLLSA